MPEINIVEKEIYRFIKEQKKNIPLSSLFWTVNINKNNEKPNFFEFFSKPHYTNTIRPVNFYKPTISIITFNEKENL